MIFLLRGAAAMVVDLSKFSSVSGNKYGEPLGDPACVYGFEKAFSVGKLIDFGDLLHPVMDCIEKLSTHQPVHSEIVSLFFITKFLTALITGQEVPAGAKFLCLSDKMSKSELFLSCFESHEEALLDCIR